MSFWDSTAAAPSFLTTLPWVQKLPRYLRSSVAPPVSPYFVLHNGKKAVLRRLFGSDSAEVAAFLTAYYGDADWCIRADNWIWGYLVDASIIALGLFEDGTLIGTIFSVPIAPGRTIMSHGGQIECLRVIEGLCVSAAYRNRGIAGFLIKHADSFTSTHFGATAHIWSREIPISPVLFSSALRTDIYGYRVCAADRSAPAIQTLDWNVFDAAWRVDSPSWVTSSHDPCIVVSVPCNRRRAHAIFYRDGHLVVITHSNRYSMRNAAIYEISWSGFWRDGHLSPAAADTDFSELLSGVAATLPAGSIFFGTTAHNGGNLKPAMAQWILGNSGAHATYLYNFMPPAFGSCMLHAVRAEI